MASSTIQTPDQVTFDIPLSLHDIRDLMEVTVFAGTGMEGYGVFLWNREKGCMHPLVHTDWERLQSRGLDDALNTVKTGDDDTVEVVNKDDGAVILVSAKLYGGSCGVLVAFGNERFGRQPLHQVVRMCRPLITAAAAVYQQNRTAEEYERILAGLGEGIVAIDRNGEIVFVNPVALELLGMDGAKPEGQELRKLVPDLENGCQHGKQERRIRTSDGNIKDMAVGVTILRDKEGNPAGSIYSLRDLSGEKDLEKMRQEFLTTVSHEFRTPLTSIKSFAEMLLNYDDTDAETRKEFLTIINRESDNLTNLVNDAIDIAKLEAGTMDWRMDTADLREVVERAVRAVQDRYRQKNIVLKNKVFCEDTRVRADRDELGKAFEKVIDNAFKFSEEGGMVELVLDAPTASEIRVQIENGGRPVPEGKEKEIFEKFVQEGDIMTDKAEGTGLGLPISRGIIGHHGGRIGVDISREGRTLFYITIPKLPKDTEEV